MNYKTRKLLSLSLFSLVVSYCAAGATTQPDNPMGIGGNDHGYDMAPETRLDVVEAAIAKIPSMRDIKPSCISPMSMADWFPATANRWTGLPLLVLTESFIPPKRKSPAMRS